MKITSKFSDSENSVYLDKISKSIKDLNSTATDSLHFVEQMVSLSALLRSFAGIWVIHFQPLIKMHRILPTL